MSSAAKRRKKKRSQAPVALVYVMTVLIFMALISMLAIYLLKVYNIIGGEEEEDPAVTVQSFNDLFARVNSKDALADLTLIRIDSANNRIILMPISSMTRSGVNGSTMRDIYAESGMAGVKDAVESTLEVRINNYAALSNESFERIFDIYGGITYKPSEELYYLSQEDDGNDIFIQRNETVTLSGRQTRLLTQYPVFSNGKQGNNEFLGEAMEMLINSMFQQSYITQDNLDNIYSMFSDTDMSNDDFRLQKSYIRQMLSRGPEPAEKIIPEGVWGAEDEYFLFNPDFIDSLKVRVGESAIYTDSEDELSDTENSETVTE